MSFLRDTLFSVKNFKTKLGEGALQMPNLKKFAVRICIYPLLQDLSIISLNRTRPLSSRISFGHRFQNIFLLIL